MNQKLNMASVMHQQEAGFSLLEVLLSIVLIGIASVGLGLNTISALRIAKLTELNYAASNLALSRIEEYAALDPSTLDDTDDKSETHVVSTGLSATFSRVTNVTVNADGSRTIHVEVTCENSSYGTSAEFETTMALWE